MRKRWVWNPASALRQAKKCDPGEPERNLLTAFGTIPLTRTHKSIRHIRSSHVSERPTRPPENVKSPVAAPNPGSARIEEDSHWQSKSAPQSNSASAPTAHATESTDKPCRVRNYCNNTMFVCCLTEAFGREIGEQNVDRLLSPCTSM